MKESLSPSARAAKIKQMVLAKAADSDGVVHEASGEIWKVREDGTWKPPFSSHPLSDRIA